MSVTNAVFAVATFLAALMPSLYGHSLKPSEVDKTISCPSKSQYNYVMLNKLADAERDMRETVHSLTDTVHSLTEQMIHCHDETDEDSQPVHVAFYAALSQSLSGIINHATIKFDDVKTNVGEAYNPETGEFEAPVGGTYAFHWVNTNHNLSWMTTELYAKGQIYGKAVSDSGDHNDRSIGSNFVILQLEKGDKVVIRASDDWHNGKMFGDYHSTFSGYRLF